MTDIKIQCNVDFLLLESFYLKYHYSNTIIYSGTMVFLSLCDNVFLAISLGSIVASIWLKSVLIIFPSRSQSVKKFSSSLSRLNFSQVVITPPAPSPPPPPAASCFPHMMTGRLCESEISRYPAIPLSVIYYTAESVLQWRSITVGAAQFGASWP